MKSIGGVLQHILLRTIKHAQRTKARGTLIVLQWVAVPFWPMLFSDSYANAWLIHEIHALDNVIICSGRHGAKLLGSCPATNLLALKVNFFHLDGGWGARSKGKRVL